MSRNRLERGQKPKKRGSGNKAKQFENAISSSMRDGVRTMKDFYDSPGFQSPIERQQEEQLRQQFIKATRDMAKDDMGSVGLPTSRYMNKELERLRQMRRKK